MNKHSVDQAPEVNTQFVKHIKKFGNFEMRRVIRKELKTNKGYEVIKALNEQNRSIKEIIKRTSLSPEKPFASLTKLNTKHYDSRINSRSKFNYTPNISEKSNILSSPDKSNSQSPEKPSLVRLKLINRIVESCSDLGKRSKTELKLIPKIQKTTLNSYRAVHEMLDALDYLSPGNKIDDCLEVKKYIDKSDEFLLEKSKKYISRSIIRRIKHIPLIEKMKVKALDSSKYKHL